MGEEKEEGGGGGDKEQKEREQDHAEPGRTTRGQEGPTTTRMARPGGPKQHQISTTSFETRLFIVTRNSKQSCRNQAHRESNASKIERLEQQFRDASLNGAKKTRHPNLDTIKTKKPNANSDGNTFRAIFCLALASVLTGLGSLAESQYVYVRRFGCVYAEATQV